MLKRRRVEPSVHANGVTIVMLRPFAEFLARCTTVPIEPWPMLSSSAGVGPASSGGAAGDST
jgi:hypothetical protein